MLLLLVLLVLLLLLLLLLLILATATLLLLLVNANTIPNKTSSVPPKSWVARGTAVCTVYMSVAPVAYQVILEPGIGQFLEFESPRVHTRIHSWGLFLLHKLTC